MTTLMGAVALLTLAGAGATPGSGKDKAVKSDVEAETKAWHQDRLSKLQAEDGWLTLVGLHWLEEGDNRAGSAEDAPVKLPSSVTAALGTFHRKGQTVRLTPAKGVQLTRNGQPFEGGEVKTDAGGKPDVLKLGMVQMLAIVRQDRVGIRVRDSASDVRRNFKGIERYPGSAEWRKDAKFVPGSDSQKTIAVPNVLGHIDELPLAGTAVFTHAGQQFKLDAVREGDSLFFIFGDQTNKTDTYGAGRFLYSELPKDGRVVVDFNRAYNPPCAFTSYATCPLPPKQNRLQLRVEAGEKRYADH